MDQLGGCFYGETGANIAARVSGAAMTVGHGENQRLAGAGARQPTDRILVWHSAAFMRSAANTLTNNLPLGCELVTVHAMSDKIWLVLVHRQTV